MDFEIAERCKDDILSITVAYSKVICKYNHIKHFIDTIRNNFSRKEQSLEIYKNCNDHLKKVAFLMLDNKGIPDNVLKNSIQFEITKNEKTP